MTYLVIMFPVVFVGLSLIPSISSYYNDGIYGPSGYQALLAVGLQVYY